MAAHAVVVPSRVNSDGTHVSFHVNNYEAKDDVLYHFPLKDDNLTLVLTPNRQFISPHLVIERRRQDNATRTYFSDFTIVQST